MLLVWLNLSICQVCVIPKLCYSRTMRDKKRENTVLTMRSKGFTFQNIGTVLGVTRQRAHQIFARKAIEKRLEAL